MPISRDQFDGLEEDGPVIEPGTNAHRVLGFPIDHPDEAFEQGEIAAETGVPRGSISVVLKRLEERGLVEHKQQWWALGADD